MEIKIRKATTEDAAILTSLGRKTFFEKWKGTTSAENMNHYLEETFNTEKITGEISDPSVLYLIAAKDGNSVGYAKLIHTHPDIEVAEPGVDFMQQNPIEISRIYILPELIGQSIGARLMEKVFEIAREENCDLVWLGVWENNPAVRFYQRHGFLKAGTHKFHLGDQVDTDWVMIKSV